MALASAPLPKKAKAYATKGFRHGVLLTLVTSATSAKVIQPGPSTGVSPFARSGGFLNCPKSKKVAGFKGSPYVQFGFPGATLKLSHGKYAFTKKYENTGVRVVGSGSLKTYTLKLKITGSAKTALLIKGTFKASGGPCTTKKAVKYTAAANNKLKVAPGQ